MRRLLPLPVTDLDDLWDVYALPAQPHVRAGFVQALDGALTADGSSRGLSGPADRAVLRTLRALADVVLVGAGTARTENYGPIAISTALTVRRRAQDQPDRPVLAVLTRDARTLDPTSRLFDQTAGRVLVLSAGSGRGSLPADVEVIGLGGTEVDATEAVALLQQRYGPRVLCEGGPHLLRRLLDADLVDELCLTLSPQLVGGAPHVLHTALPLPRPAWLASLVEHEGELLVRWSLRQPAPISDE